MNERRRAVYAGLRFGMLAVSVLADAYLGARAFPRYTSAEAIGLGVAFAVFVALLRFNVPDFFAVYGKRRTVRAGRLPLELPICVTVLAIYGPAAAAAMELCGHPLAVPSDGRSRLMRRVLNGGSDALLWLCLGAMRPLFLAQTPDSTPQSFIAFCAYYLIGVAAFRLLVWTPLKTLAHPVSIVRLWRDSARNTRLWAYLAGLTAWGYVCTIVWQRAGLAFGAASFVPLLFLGQALRTLHAQRLELHRLRLARDAVQAMLRTNDPLPQMNSLLGSLHTPAAEETLQIYASLSADERPAPLATIGPLPDAEEQEAVRRAIAQLAHGDRASVVHRTARGGVTAYAVRAPDDELLGTLVVHRTARTSPFVPARRFAQAAAEIAPLLRDFRSIAATQNAARVDPLTSLPNRRTIMQMLRERIENVSIGNPCAVLVLDIDHFKAINDSLGHQAGDRVLRTIGSLIAHNIRSVDRAGRIGGEEFVVLMPDTNSETARTVGERLRSAIEQSELRHAGGEPLTASIGIAVAAISDTVDSLLARADRALYQAKRQGRNRVIEISA